MPVPVYIHVLYLGGEKYYLKPVDGGKTDSIADDTYAVVDTNGFPSYYLVRGQLKTGVHDPQKEFGNTPYFMGQFRFGESSRFLGHALDPKNSEMMGWIVPNRFNDHPLDLTPPYLRILDVKRDGNDVIISGAAEPESRVQVSIRGSGGEETRDIAVKDLLFTWKQHLNGGEKEIAIVATDDSGNSSRKLFSIDGTNLREPNEWEDDRKEYLRILAGLKAAGYNIKFDSAINTSSPFMDRHKNPFDSAALSAIGAEWDEAYKKDTGKRVSSKEWSGNPLALLKDSYEAKLFFDGSIVTDRMVKTNPLHVKFDQTADGKRVRIINYLDGRTLLDETFSKSEFSNMVRIYGNDEELSGEPAFERLSLAAKKAYGEFLAVRGAKDLDSLVAAETARMERPSTAVVYEPFHERPLDVAAWKRWKDVAAGFPDGMSVMTFPDRGKVDQAIGRSQDGLVQFKVELDAIGKHPILAKGNVKFIKFGASYKEYIYSKGFFEKDRKAFFAKLKEDKAFDRHRNFIRVVHDGDKIVGITIERPPNLRDGSSADPYEPVPVDLSKWGLGELPPIMWEVVKHPARTSGSNYRLYNDYGEKDFDAISPYLGQVFRSAAEVETAFGLKPGSAIKNIYLVNSQEENASVRRNYPETIWIWSEIVPAIKQEKGPVFHESVHVVDDTHGISSEGAFAVFFKGAKEAASKGEWVSKQFLEIINESNSLPAQAGGHAADNTMEAFASLLTGLSHWKEDAFRQKFDEMPSSLKKTYSQACLAAASSIEDKLPAAPIIGQLREAAKTLDS